VSGRVEAIAIAAKKRGAMEPVDVAEVTVAKGITGDARGHLPGRQVTLLFADGWDDACRELGEALPWTTRRANVLVGGMDAPARIGARLKVGSTLLEVTEETKPCQLMERAAAGLRKALAPDWRGGVCCKVLEGGTFTTGDAVELAA
jgi:MOSC domain-containing protein YiiM